MAEEELRVVAMEVEVEHTRAVAEVSGMDFP